ncbi:MAG: tRNA (5-methylaminomethyl-2-thiouridine)(34)-methyltransferase MnmD [Bacteroidetes bacterium]|nr:tRNA (5-methylaminomethyl-2-thiouridine)(34)-methyltransferase MnmD [Bacteroidota bacterium]MDA0860121.1 tRNA (5-methylaminomethyl-2-thiouridine)(34)-methyltransferase MnmD [Bacteroidota bacterium]MDA1318218.1 tRNA (5-methylaminomethyl-2-thiouridine)(34)-methyltransferase MnmD [Bacteroidota bacterium]
MKRSIITTADGSKTIQIEDWNEQYHSIHGALQEAKHVYIENGLHEFLQRQPNQKQINILEIGFGTGLNAMLSATDELALQKSILYHSIEAYPVSSDELQALNYSSLLTLKSEIFDQLHSASWNKESQIIKHFVLKKRQEFFADIKDVNTFDIVYFDAFSPRVQPDLWIPSIFKMMYTAMRFGGILVTYSAKGSVRRAMQEVGFEVKRLAGPPGKREMLRATKIS